jgi:tetratricopeptide (TPR) repeat protein
MGFSLLLVQRLAPRLGLNEETAKAAKPGKFARLMEERSGLPPENERAALLQRQNELRNLRKNLTLMVFPARVAEAADTTSATDIVRMITDAGLCKAVPAPKALVLKASRADPNELKILWDLAREFREYVRSNPPAADYVLYADYGLNSQTREVGFVHFVVCDRKGEWVVVDMQNSLQPDFQSVRPTSSTGCSALLVKRLGTYLKLSAADLVREKIGTSGIDAAAVAFHEARAKPDEYNVSEQDINGLGYEYLQSKRFKEAIAVFTMNVEAFPESFNVYDSLGEAYAAAGEKDLAIKNYEKSLQLNPNSRGGIEALKKLKGK